MLPPKNATQPYRDACESLIIDSDPSRPSVTTRDVLDCAAELGAEAASLSDVYQDKDATVDSLLEGLEIADDHTYNGNLLIPLQEPFVECYKEIGEPDEMLGIGGLKDATTAKRISAVENLRECVGDEAWIHGFGWGPADGMGKEIRKKPDLIDSMDYSTPVQNVRYKESAPGEERMSVTAAKSGAALVRNLRELSPLVDVESDNNMTMDEFCKSD